MELFPNIIPLANHGAFVPASRYVIWIFLKLQVLAPFPTPTPTKWTQKKTAVKSLAHGSLKDPHPCHLCLLLCKCERPDLRPPRSEWSAGCRNGPASDFSCWLFPLPPRHSFRVGSAPQFRGPCWACDKHFINIHPLRDVEQPGTPAASARAFGSAFSAPSTRCPPLGPGWPRHRMSPYDSEMQFLWNGSGPCPFEKPRAMAPLLRVNGSSLWMRCGGKVCAWRKSF